MAGSVEMRAQRARQADGFKWFIGIGMLVGARRALSSGIHLIVLTSLPRRAVALMLSATLGHLQEVTYRRFGSQPKGASPLARRAMRGELDGLRRVFVLLAHAVTAGLPAAGASRAAVEGAELARRRGTTSSSTCRS
jgi:hypothetical protein